MRGSEKPLPGSDAPTLVPENSGTIAPTLTPVPQSSDAETFAGVPNNAPQPSESAAGSGLQPGFVLGGRYEILAALGEGGMGAVYKARDRELDRLVALKVIRPDLARNPAIIQRFKQELILARQITQRNVVRIFDLGEAAGIKFITMEYVEGQDLHSLLQAHKKFAPKDAVEIILQVCHALEAAHGEVANSHSSDQQQDANHDEYERPPFMEERTQLRNHGLRLGSHRRGRGDDPDRRSGRNHGLHVARASLGQRS